MRAVAVFACLVMSVFCLAGNKVLGKLGQTTQQTKIYASKSTKSRVYYTAPQHTYVVVPDGADEAWVPVIMANRATGYIPAGTVEILPYTIQTSDATETKAPTQPTVRGTGSTSVDWMLSYAFNFMGTPYKWGGNSLTRGIDCSAFVQQLFRKIGVKLPRTAAEQARVGQNVERLEHLVAGDRLYFWDKKRNKIGHTGIFLGYSTDGAAKFIHSSTNTRGVGISDLRKGNWRKTLMVARRSVLK